MTHLVTGDLAKPASLQPIDTPSGLAKPTPMWLIQRPCLTKDYCRCTTTRFDEPSWFYLMPQRTSSRMRLLRLLRISPRLFLDNLRIAIQPAYMPSPPSRTYSSQIESNGCACAIYFSEIWSLDRMVARDLAKPASLQPIGATYGLAKPTPMHRIRRPSLDRAHGVQKRRK